MQKRSHDLTESTQQKLDALQSQVEELDVDVYEGMCALGIESNRVAALVDALVSVGVDPNPILNAVENEHLAAAAAAAVDMGTESTLGCTNDVHSFDGDVSDAMLLPDNDALAACDALCVSSVYDADSSVCGGGAQDACTRRSQALVAQSADGTGDVEASGTAVWGDFTSTSPTIEGKSSVHQLPPWPQGSPT